MSINNKHTRYTRSLANKRKDLKDKIKYCEAKILRLKNKVHLIEIRVNETLEEKIYK